MRDYWNDPPEVPEPPSCPNDKYYDNGNTSGFCPGTGEYLYDGKDCSVWSCDTCGYQWTIPLERDPEPPDDIDPVSGYRYDQDIPDPICEAEQIKPCPHGKIESCDACDYLGDIAYDTAREQRHFGR